MDDTTKLAPQAPSTATDGDGHDEVQGYGIRVPQLGPGMPATGMLTPTTGGLTFAPGLDTSIIAVRKAGEKPVEY